MSIVRQLLILAALAAVGAGGWWVWSTQMGGDSAGKKAGGQRPPAAVTVAAVQLSSNSVRVEAVGTGQAVQSVTVYPSVAGEVDRVSFRAGQAVEAGAELVHLDDEDERLAVDLARVEVEQARQLLKRYERTAPMGAVSASEVDSARTEVERARIALARAEVALRDRTILAPFSGVVGIAQVDPGDRVGTDTVLTTLDDRSALFIDFEVPEAVAQSIAVGDPLHLSAWSLPDVALSGSVDALGSRIDPVTRTLSVRARVPNPEDRLRPGMSFAISMTLPGRTLPAVPEVAVLWSRDGAYIWRLGEGNTAERVAIQILRRENAWVIVEADLAEGDRVVVEGVQRVREGRPVKISDPVPAVGGTTDAGPVSMAPGGQAAASAVGDRS